MKKFMLALGAFLCLATFSACDVEIGPEPGDLCDVRGASACYGNMVLTCEMDYIPEINDYDVIGEYYGDACGYGYECVEYRGAADCLAPCASSEEGFRNPYNSYEICTWISGYGYYYIVSAYGY